MDPQTLALEKKRLSEALKIFNTNANKEKILKTKGIKYLQVGKVDGLGSVGSGAYSISYKNPAGVWTTYDFKIYQSPTISIGTVYIPFDATAAVMCGKILKKKYFWQFD
jgi:hypothetical protein